MKRLLFTLLASLTITASYGQDTLLTENLKCHVYTLASDQLLGRKGGTASGAQARMYIINEFKKAGLLPGLTYYGSQSYLEPFTVGETDYANVVGILNGEDSEVLRECIIVGAHYDHLGFKIKGRDTIIFHGADDNASGSAVLIELARQLKARNNELKRSVILVAFDGEEQGLYGSIELSGVVDLSSVKFMMSIDMVGYLNKAKKLQINGIGCLKNSNNIFDSIPTHDINVKTAKYDQVIFSASDNLPFRMRGVPAVSVTTGTTKSPYHQPHDTADKIDYEGMALITAYLTDLVITLSNAETLEPK